MVLEIMNGFNLKSFLFLFQPIEHIRVCMSVKEKPLVEYRMPDVRTLYDVLPKGKEISSSF